MSETEDERHLLRATGHAALRPLGGPTGLARLALEERTLAAGERLEIAGPGDAEGFVYVLAGAGVTQEAGGIAAGDFLGLAPGDRLIVTNPDTAPLRLLIGFSSGGAAAFRSVTQRKP